MTSEPETDTGRYADPEWQRLAAGAPFSYDCGPAPAEKSRRRATLASLGMRELPHPFTSIVAFMSDTDRSNRTLYERYVGQLVREQGLDFGDSVWLETTEAPYPGGGFLHPDLETPREVLPPHDGGLTFHELLREHFDGNVDHWHSFLVRGPRLLPLTGTLANDALCIQVPDERPPPNAAYNSRHFRLGALVFVLREQDTATVPVLDVTLTVDDRETTLVYARDPALESVIVRLNPDVPLACYRLQGTARPGDVVLAGGRVALTISAPDGGLPDPLEIVAINHTGAEILAALERLARLGVRFNAITTHALWHFYTAASVRLLSERSQAAAGDAGAARDSYFGEVRLGRLRFSTLADDPDSFACVFPEAADRYGLRFLRIRDGGDAGSGEGVNHTLDGWFDIHDVIRPTLARDGRTCVYAISGVKPSIATEHLRPGDDATHKTVARNFAPRLETLFRQLAAAPGGVHLFHTHFGNLQPAQQQVPEPYFPAATIATLANLALADCAPGASRVRPWFTRLSTACAYALAVQRLPARVSRKGADRIDIEPGFDPLLNRVYPQAAEELYGVTFEVGDPAAAEVRLAGQPLTALVRTPGAADPGGIVTIAACGIRRTLFDELDPAIGARMQANGAQWQWRTDGDAASGRAYARVVIAGHRGVGLASAVLRRLRRPRRDTRAIAYRYVRLQRAFPTADGATTLSFWLRRSSTHVRFAFVLETLSGVPFAIGNPALIADLPGLAAAFALDALSTVATPDDWTRVVVPLYALDWRMPPGTTAARIGQPLAALSVVVDGSPGEWIDIDALEYGRPQTAFATGDTERITVGGRVADRFAGRRVSLRSRAAGECRDTLTGHAGWFVFAGVPPGPLHLEAGGRTLACECYSSTLNLVLDAPS